MLFSLSGHYTKIKVKVRKKGNIGNTLSLIGIMLFVLVSSCKKDRVESTIPYVPVNITVILSLPEYQQLNSPGSSAIISGGYRGIIIYRRSIQEFVAFDLACPYDPTESGAILTLESGGLTLLDNKCGSTFNLYDGSINHGPASRPMKGYNCQYFPSDNSLLISN